MNNSVQILNAGEIQIVSGGHGDDAHHKHFLGLHIHEITVLAMTIAAGAVYLFAHYPRLSLVAIGAAAAGVGIYLCL